MTKQPIDSDTDDDQHSSPTKRSDADADSHLSVLDRAGDAIDDELTRYKTDELKQRFQQLFGVTHFLPVAAAGLAATVVGLLVLWGVLFLPRASPPISALTLVYMGLQGLFVGVLAAALLVVARLFQQITAIVDITVQTLREALRDLRQLSDPDRRAELTGALIHGAVVPSIQSVITVKMGLLRAPIGFVLNRILKKTANRLTEGIETKMVDTDGDDEPLQLPEDGADDSAEPDDDSHLARMHRRIETIARRTRRATLIPASLVFVVVALVSSLPWIVTFLTIL